ncbi:ATP-binding protein [Candidatus Magnetominusculus xianensis]|uniref:histidine kinase n=1 Tax=Candidatus Magnetominusculus xianensis TaxID=1748249 RepID=A0ABR5SD66_9BACT|nr:ATP-binding protein [Candidatus Magnetominusculus xianensis]KWT82801.1 multi-sensor signal transduction histidine kinase [Candidatus Magnetominusculus xianensis]MBF0403489.1 PAS domain-containing protein [Nitrospirota bacterium]
MKKLQNRILVNFLPLTIIPALIIIIVCVTLMERQIAETFGLMLRNGIRGVDEEFDFMEHRFLDNARSIAESEDIVAMTERQDNKALLDELPRIQTLLGASSIRVYNHEGLALAGGNYRVPTEYNNDISKKIVTQVLREKDICAVMKTNKGVGFDSFVQIRVKGNPVGVLEVIKLLDYDLLSQMKAEFGTDMIVYNGEHPQAITMTNASIMTDPNLIAMIGSANTNQRELTMEMVLGGLVYYVGVKPIMYETEQIGTLVFAASGEKAYRERMILKIAVLPSIAILLLTAIYMSRRVSLKVVQPIKTLCKVTQEISEGSRSVTADIKSDDEVGVLADSFNKMIKELRMHQNHLNVLVEEKTRELIETNKDLLNEMIARKKAQSQNELTLNLLQNIADNVPGAIYQFRLHKNGSSCFPYASAAFREIFRVDPNEVREDASVVFSVIHPDDYDGVIASVNKSAQDLTHWHHEIRLLFDDGTMRWVLASSKPQKEADNSVIWHGFITDITERKHMEEELVELNRTLEQRITQETDKRLIHEQILIQQSKMAAMGEMIGLIAHQWRQPLNAIGLNVQDIKDSYNFGELNENTIEQIVSTTMNQIFFMSKTIDDFRDFFKPSKKKLVFDVRKTIEELLSMFMQVFSKSNIDVLINTAPDTLPFTEGYPNEFKQVLLNILNNAKDAINSDGSTPIQIRGQIELTIENNEVKDKIIISIRDNGGGIPAHIIDKIFEPYYSTKGREGTGLGLYMSKTIVETNMGGTLTVRNTDNGAEFVISLEASAQQDALSQADL